MIFVNLYIYSIIIPALLPVAVILWYIYKKDTLDKEPHSLLLKVFIFGALSCLPAVILELIMQKILPSFVEIDTVDFVWAENFYGVGLVEELCKWAVFMYFIWKNKHFDYYYDGVVYAVTISLGFAGLENILYIINYGHSVVILRALLAIPGHATDAVFMGFFLARAKAFSLKNEKIRQVFLLILSVLVPAIIHGIYDFLCTTTGGWSFVIFLLYVIVIDIIAWFTLKNCFTTDAPFQPKISLDDDIYKI